MNLKNEQSVKEMFCFVYYSNDFCVDPNYLYFCVNVRYIFPKNNLDFDPFQFLDNLSNWFICKCQFLLWKWLNTIILLERHFILKTVLKIHSEYKARTSYRKQYNRIYTTGFGAMSLHYAFLCHTCLQTVAVPDLIRPLKSLSRSKCYRSSPHASHSSCAETTTTHNKWAPWTSINQHCSHFSSLSSAIFPSASQTPFQQPLAVGWVFGWINAAAKLAVRGPGMALRAIPARDMLSPRGYNSQQTLFQSSWCVWGKDFPGWLTPRL